MTTIYRVEGDLSLMQIAFVDAERTQQFQKVRGRRGDAEWIPPQVEVLVDADDLPPAWVAVDLAYFSGLHLMLSGRAVAALRPWIGPHGEFLPVRADIGDYAIFNCFTEIDAFDDEHTEGRRFQSSGRFMRICRYALYAERLLDPPPIFRLVGQRAPLFVTDAFRAAVEQHRLTGFVFEPLWSSETGGIRLPEVEIWERDPAGARRAAQAKRLAILQAEAERSA
jgi:hypothetical protein